MTNNVVLISIDAPTINNLVRLLACFTMYPLMIPLNACNEYIESMSLLGNIAIKRL